MCLKVGVESPAHTHVVVCVARDSVAGTVLHRNKVSMAEWNGKGCSGTRPKGAICMG